MHWITWICRKDSIHLSLTTTTNTCLSSERETHFRTQDAAKLCSRSAWNVANDNQKYVRLPVLKSLEHTIRRGAPTQLVANVNLIPVYKGCAARNAVLCRRQKKLLPATMIRDTLAHSSCNLGWVTYPVFQVAMPNALSRGFGLKVSGSASTCQCMTMFTMQWCEILRVALHTSVVNRLQSYAVQWVSSTAKIENWEHIIVSPLLGFCEGKCHAYI